jgi:enterochelin esterase-like enzyme
MSRGSRAAWLTALALAAATSVAAREAGRDLRLGFPAAALGQAARDVRVHLPASYTADSASGRRYPVVYLLHGFPGGSGDWLGRAHAGEIADSLAASGSVPEVILVCPDGDRGFFGRSMWMDRWDGSFPLARSLVEDLIPWVDARFRTLARSEDRAIIGLSDGATGGLALLRDHPGLFTAWGGHSGGYELNMDFGMRSVVGSGPEGEQRLAAMSPLSWIRTRDDLPRGARLYFDCGRDDESLVENRQLHDRLDSLGVAHTWNEFPGSHTWDYWRSHLHQSLVAVCRGMAVGEARGEPDAAAREPAAR